MARRINCSNISPGAISGAPSVPGYEGFGLPGTICRLPDLACPLDGLWLWGAVPRSLPVSVAASAPIDIIDSDLPCLCPLVLLPNVPLGDMGDFRSPMVEGVFNDNAGRCPRTWAGGGCDAKDDLRDTEGLVEGWTGGGSLRCLSPPGAKPFCLRVGERSRPSGVAVFLKVIVHSMSSPANTVGFFHCAKTRMFEAMVGGAVEDAGCRMRAAHRWWCCSDMAPARSGLKAPAVNSLQSPRFTCRPAAISATQTTNAVCAWDAPDY
jgi:hypothetical protein